MNNRKASSKMFGEGGMRPKSFRVGVHEAGLGKIGQAKVNGAVSEGLRHVEKKYGLKLGVGGNHLDEALKFIDTKYKGRFELTDKHKNLIRTSFEKHYGIKNEPKPVPKVEAKPKTPPPVARPKPVAPPPHSIIASPPPSESTRVLPMSPRNEEGSDTKSAP